MEHQICILLHSKYSNLSQELIDLIQSYPIQFQNNLNLELICIDNKNIRRKIMKSNNIKIDVVPCLLRIFSNGGVEKYDGLKAFDWLSETLSNLSSEYSSQGSSNNKSK